MMPEDSGIDEEEEDLFALEIGTYFPNDENFLFLTELDCC
jgi:hypothetical protein